MRSPSSQSGRAVSQASALALMFTLGVLATPVHADSCDSSGTAGDSYLDIGVTCETPGSTEPGSGDPGQPAQPEPYVAYRWASICTGSPEVSPGDVECTAALSCPVPQERRWQLWGQYADGRWVTLRTGCFGGTPPEYVPPTVTPADVLTALRRVGLPGLVTHIQPAGKTLVNLDTIFFAEPHTVAVTLTILGQAVDVVATPESYLWHFGDGASLVTDVPGAAYPDTTVTHRYLDAHTTVSATVEVTYSARFRVGGGDWQDVDGTVTVAGPPTSLRIAEATPLLSGDGN